MGGRGSCVREYRQRLTQVCLCTWYDNIRERDGPPYAHDGGDRGSGGGDSSDPDGSDSSEDEDPLLPYRGASKKRPRNRGKKGSKRHKYEWNSEKNIPNSLCELPKLETARDYDFLVWKEKSFHSIWGK